MDYKYDHFVARLNEYQIPVSGQQLEQFGRYYELLVETNRVMNLTAITDWDEVLEKHFLDSLAIVSMLGGSSESLNFSGKMRLMDIGTGAGFPGIPIKIIFPEIEVMLTDSLNKRVGFLNTVIGELNLKKIRSIHGRAEDIARISEHRERYDLVVSRAVANLSTLAEYCLPFVKTGGTFVAYKSEDCDAEVAAADRAVALLGGAVREVKKFHLGEAGRAFVVIDKKKTTPGKYPRKAGTPSKEPLS